MTTKFKSSDPAVIAWWDEAAHARANFSAEVDAFEAEYGMGRKAVVLGGWTISVVGLEYRDEDRTAPPDGWRVVKGKAAWWIQPYRRSKAQKAIHAAMPKMAEPRDSLPGYETSFFGGQPGLFRHEGVVYAETSAPERFDPEVWTEILRSEYLTAEAAHAAEVEATAAAGVAPEQGEERPSSAAARSEGAQP